MSGLDGSHRGRPGADPLNRCYNSLINEGTSHGSFTPRTSEGRRPCRRRACHRRLATSGHEYEYLGGEAYLAQAPPPSATRLWLHIGASAAARDWHELGPTLRPLPSADSQRVLTATADIIDRTRAAFRGVSGLEATYVADAASAGGELINVLRAGYGTAIGLYGGHRYFHTRGDDLRCVSADLVQPVAAALRGAVAACLAEG